MTATSRGSSDEELEALVVECYRTVARWTDWQILGMHEDGHGPHSFSARHARRGGYVMAAKRELHQGLASFMEKIVDRAAGTDRWLCLFVGKGTPTPGSAWVFCPGRVRAVGEAFQIESKKRVRVDALQLDAKEHGVLLGDHLGGRHSPPRGPPEHMAQHSLRTYGGGN